MRSWLYCAIYPGAFDRLDGVIQELVAGTRGLVEAGTERNRWFFLRFFDVGGPHVRLRVQGPVGLLDEVHADLVSRFPDFLRKPHTDSGIPVASMPETSPTDYWEAVDFRLYEPELRRYGGAEGVRVAEDNFMTSSAIALRAVGAGLGYLQRQALASLTMKSALRHCLPGAEEQFWSKYFWYWTGRDEPFAPAGRTAAAESAARLKPVIGAAGDDLPPPLLADAVRYGGAIRATAAEAIAAGVPLTTWQWVFHLLHLHNNRLGITPGDEAVLAALLGGTPKEDADASEHRSDGRPAADHH
ncbi:thiopeptide-type bacteriocin biosynthesis protein [Spongiactinospora sp. TRM90649]|uniref:thiopeptide-type bacteriocin biosynthesis protein n=1 Tax=Spongiactinospora sp. TRM90649 TaxID=3031114 RepID=UPI0023F9387D|nr:thiopeptide-type bacteriocin biosynthesis protein [Spongiactinospora sp. TRM90649]MDF5752171.1 thiopeptide-type bacteriocin biosynthesis protein [Spongiactinospora sp. TRM90649]